MGRAVADRHARRRLAHLQDLAFERRDAAHRIVLRRIGIAAVKTNSGTSDAFYAGQNRGRVRDAYAHARKSSGNRLETRKLLGVERMIRRVRAGEVCHQKPDFGTRRYPVGIEIVESQPPHAGVHLQGYRPGPHLVRVVHHRNQVLSFDDAGKHEYVEGFRVRQNAPQFASLRVGRDEELSTFLRGQASRHGYHAKTICVRFHDGGRTSGGAVAKLAVVRRKGVEIDGQPSMGHPQSAMSSCAKSAALNIHEAPAERVYWPEDG